MRTWKVALLAIAITVVLWIVISKAVTGCYTAICG
jgi:hypothetical protein